jgi:hypothetical protein
MSLHTTTSVTAQRESCLRPGDQNRHFTIGPHLGSEVVTSIGQEVRTSTGEVATLL